MKCTKRLIFYPQEALQLVGAMGHCWADSIFRTSHREEPKLDSAGWAGLKELILYPGKEPLMLKVDSNPTLRQTSHPCAFCGEERDLAGNDQVKVQDVQCAPK